MLRLAALAIATFAATLVGATPSASEASPAQGSARPFSHAEFDTVLRRHLRDGRVDYRGLAAHPGPLRRYLAACAEAQPDEWPAGEQVAFWVNAYNATVLQGVIRRPGLKSVLDVGKTLGIPTLGFFRERGRVARAMRSLDDIEHGILRERFKDARIHFVLNCASTSCPVLPERALRPDSLDAELNRATLRFLTDPTRNRIEPPSRIELSSIFKWYRDDFVQTDGSLVRFIEHYGAPGWKFRPYTRVEFLRYDWSLNGSW